MLRQLPAIVLVALTAVTGAGAAGAKNPSPIRVTLNAKNHHPRVSDSPYVHWWYCVQVRTAAGKSVASGIYLQILSSNTPVQDVGYVSVKKGYDHWCAAIGGEASVPHGLPRGKKLIFQSVVRAEGVMVKRNWRCDPGAPRFSRVDL